MRQLKPESLKKGDLIGIVSPASPIADPSKINRGVHYLESLGYRAIVGANVTKTKGYLAGDDAERASDLETMFSNRHVRAIICVRGGYGTPRLLARLNYRLITQNPKIFVGFSDITSLSMAFWKKCGLITFHGPMLGVDMADKIEPFTEDFFWRTLTSKERLGRVSLPQDASPISFFPGKSTGRLLGGNLSMIVSMLGTPYQPNFNGTVLFIEENGEEPYRVDRMMMQLRNASVLSKTKAVLAGQFTDCVPEDPSKASFSVEDILHESATSAAKPFLANMPFGHVGRKMTLPVGLKVRVDAASKVVEYLESAVT